MYSLVANVTLVGCGEAQAHAYGGGFASAIGANNAKALTRLDVKAQVLHHCGVAKAFNQVLTLQQRRLAVACVVGFYRLCHRVYRVGSGHRCLV
jgi:hypothetical protein